MAVKNTEINKYETRRTSSLSEGFSSVREPLYIPKEAPSKSPSRYDRTKRVRQEEYEYHPIPTSRSLTLGEVKVIALTIFIVTAILLGIIFIAAQAAVIQKEINDLNNEITQINEDITSIKVSIEQAKNIQSIGERARNELGMTEPRFDQYVYINELQPIEGSFANFIREKLNGTIEGE